MENAGRLSDGDPLVWNVLQYTEAQHDVEGSVRKIEPTYVADRKMSVGQMSPSPFALLNHLSRNIDAVIFVSAVDELVGQ